MTEKQQQSIDLDGSAKSASVPATPEKEIQQSSDSKRQNRGSDGKNCAQTMDALV